MQQHFASDPRIAASLLLLQERIPKAAPPKALDELGSWRLTSVEPGAPVRSFSDPDTPTPELQLLSNGSYHVMVTQAGGGYSRWKDLAVTRWHEDPTCDAMGSFCYVRDIDSGEFWTTSWQPTRHAASRHQAVLSEGKAEFRCSHDGIQTHLEISVSPEDQVELRRLHIRNTGRSARRIELTSYAEVVLAPAAADAQHPAFSKLFVHSEILADAAALLCQRRPRGPADASPWLFHLVAPHRPRGVSLLDTVSYESDRAGFIGRGGSLAAPAALRAIAPLAGSAGPVLDPVAAGRCTLRIEPDRTAVVDFVTGVGDDRAGCVTLIEKYRDRQLAERVFELAWTHGQVLLRQLNAHDREAQLFARMAGAILYHQRGLRADPALMAQNRRSQSGLWGYAISGDLPIVLVQIAEAANLDLVRQLVVAHAWWRMKGLAVDLVIWNEERDTYRQRLHEQILGLIAAGIEAHVVDRPGGIFVRHADQIPHEDRVLLMSVARIVLSDRSGSLGEQLERRPLQERRRSARGAPRGSFERRSAPFVARRTPRIDEPVDAVPVPQPPLRHFNGLGGFNADATEYVIAPADGQPTPAPWVNVVANPQLGSVISETGLGYTWFENAHEYRLTPWHNDPVTDPSGEMIYLRDEDSGQFWGVTPTPAPGGAGAPGRVRHGFGYTVFEQSAHGMRSSLQVYVALDSPVKFMRLRLHNDSGRARRLSATAMSNGCWATCARRPRRTSLPSARPKVAPCSHATPSTGTSPSGWPSSMSTPAIRRWPASPAIDRNSSAGIAACTSRARCFASACPAATARRSIPARRGRCLWNSARGSRSSSCFVWVRPAGARMPSC
jgi:cyclic beta-1,2-glucan synthetase